MPLTKCNLTSVQIHASHLSSSKVTDCNISNSTLYHPRSITPYPIISKSIIKNSTLDNLQIHSSTLIATKINNCQVFNSIIPLPIWYGKNLLASRFKEGTFLKRCTINTIDPNSQSPLRKLHAEIFEMISNYCVESGPDNRSPARIAAMRGDQKLYDATLRCFYKQNRFKVNSKTLKYLENMPVKLLQTVHALHIEFKFHPCILLNHRIEEVHFSSHLDPIFALSAWKVVEELRTVKVVSVGPPHRVSHGNLVHMGVQALDCGFRVRDVVINGIELVERVWDKMGVRVGGQGKRFGA